MPMVSANHPLYVKAGTILPLAPNRQYTSEPVDKPMTLRIYPGHDGEFVLYQDDGNTLDYREGEYTKTKLVWNEDKHTLTLKAGGGKPVKNQTFNIEIAGKQEQRTITYRGEKMSVTIDSK